MTRELDRRITGLFEDEPRWGGDVTPGKRSLTAGLPPPAMPTPVPIAHWPGAVQRKAGAGGGATADAVPEIAARGTEGSGSALPHLATIQRASGRHDVSGVVAYVGGAAAEASRELGAEAYATGDRVAFASSPDLHTAAHEAAHVVQQRSGVQLLGGVGEVGDPYELHADAVADAVVAGQSAEPLLAELPGSGGGGGTQTKAVQRYTRSGAARISNNKDLVVVDGGTHNQAYATAGEIQAGAQRLQGSGSHVAMAAGAALDPTAIGLTGAQVNANLRQVEVRAAVSQDDTQQGLDKQNDDSLVTAELYIAIARNVIAGLADDGEHAEHALTNDMENGTAKATVTQVYSDLAGNYNPANIARAAAARGLAPRYVRLIMQKLIEYHEQIKAEINAGGFTTPKDCGQVARNFVRGGDVRYHALTQDEQRDKGYSGHYFAMVLEDGSDKVSLENAVGASKFEQLWKSANFDAMWHFEMRGAAVDVSDTGDEETHGTGASKQTLVRDSADAQRMMNDVRRNQATVIGRADEELTRSPDQTAGKDGYQELDVLVPANAAQTEREKDLLIAAIAYANQHINDDHKGRKARVNGWRTAIQRVIDRGGPNRALARHALERMAEVGKHVW